MPKETISEHGIVRTSDATNKLPNTLLAGEEFKKFRTHGTPIEKKDTKQIRHTTADQKNSMETTFDSSQLNLISDLRLSLFQGRSRIVGNLFLVGGEPFCGAILRGGEVRWAEVLGDQIAGMNRIFLM